MIDATTLGYGLLAAAPLLFGWQNRAKIGGWLQQVIQPSPQPSPAPEPDDMHEICQVLDYGRQWAARDAAVAAQFFDTARLIVKRIEEDAKEGAQ